MTAKMQYQMTATEIEVLLCLTRTGTLAEAGARLGVDGSTVFRTVQRIEKGLGQRLFERGRSGYQATDLALQLAQHAERIESELEAARSLVHNPGGEVAGNVRITTTDSILHGLLLHPLQQLAELHPALHFEINTGNELRSLTKRDADIALRMTNRPPEHLVGKNVGAIRSALFTGTRHALPEDPLLWRWIGLDEVLPDHPTVRWRKDAFAKATPYYFVNSLVTMMEMIDAGLGVGVLPLFLASTRASLRPIMAMPEPYVAPLWLLTHPESRHLRRISTVFQFLSTRLLVDQAEA
jgi:DNA-binding transcriptional LysR family regulator